MARPLLIVALSGRALAQQATQALWPVVVVDAFADRDTRACPQTMTVALSGIADWQLSSLKAALMTLRHHDFAGILYGAGLEAWPQLVGWMRRRWPRAALWGNDAAVLQLLKNPRRLAHLLHKLNIPHPEMCFAPPLPAGTSGEWLRKNRGACGGHHVQPLGAGQSFDPRHTYAQRKVAGQPCSALFLADGRQATILAFNEIHSAPGSFDYRGGLGPITFAQGVADQVAVAIGKLTRTLGLRGINGVDFICDGDRWSLVDINARPTAAMDFYTGSTNLVAAHIDACRGHLPALPPLPQAHEVRGMRVLYAPATLAPQKFPGWCRDLPATLVVSRGAPLSTVHGHARSIAVLRRQLEARSQKLLNRCQTWALHD